MENTSVHGHVFEDVEEAAEFLGVSVENLLTQGHVWFPQYELNTVGQLSDMLLDVE